MAYRRPGVTVTQEFVGLVPALAAFSLPCVAVGPVYQLVDDDQLGTYTSVEELFPYTSLMGGAAADLEDLDPEELFPITKKPIEVVLKTAVVEVLAEQDTGAVVGDLFSDATPSQFVGVAAGDVLTVVEVLDVAIVAARTDGLSYKSTGLTNRLGAPVATQFVDVKVGDTVTVTGLTPAIAGAYVVTAKVGSGLLLLDGAINDGSDDSVAVNYSIAGDRGTLNAGDYVVKAVTDDNNLVLQSPLADTPEAPLTYVINRKVGDLVLDRVASVSENGFVASAAGITLPAALLYGTQTVVSGYVQASYRALRSDLATEVRTFTDVASLNAVFGVGQIIPANPLAYGLSIMLQNTVTPVNGLGLDATAVSNEVLSYTAATDVLKRGSMYAIALLTQNPVVHTLYKNHVEQMSAPGRKLERVVIINSKLPLIAVLQEEATTSVASNGARTVVNTALTGSGVFATSPVTLIDPTTDKFINVAAGDNVVVVAGGVGTIPGTYTVASKTNNNTLVFSAPFLSSGTPADVQYYVYRKDGLAAGGASFYDRSAQFLSNGVAAGHYLDILAGSLAGRYAVATVVSEKELTLYPVVIAATSLVTAVNYQVDRDLSKVEQADAVKGYSESFASRRVVHVWPDSLEAPVGQSIYNIPGYYGCCSIAALTTGLPTQQGFTNLAVSGFLGFSHSTRYFTEEELDNIADGGTMIFAQDGADQPLYVRHQLTTDRSAIKFQEYSITKNVDFIAKFWRNTYAKFIGQYNIVDTTMDSLKTTAGAGIKFLKDNTRIPKFGGVIRSGNLKSIKESDTQIDTVLIGFSFSIPVPLNNIDITIQV